MQPQAVPSSRSANPSSVIEKRAPTAKTVGTPLIVLLLGVVLLLASDNFLRLSRTISRNRRDIGRYHASNPQLLPQLRIHSGKHVLVFFQEGADVLATLADALALVAVPGAALVHDVVQHREIE